jgi:hypothetical protein
MSKGLPTGAVHLKLQGGKVDYFEDIITRRPCSPVDNYLNVRLSAAEQVREISAPVVLFGADRKILVYAGGVAAAFQAGGRDRSSGPAP